MEGEDHHVIRIALLELYALVLEALRHIDNLVGVFNVPDRWIRLNPLRLCDQKLNVWPCLLRKPGQATNGSAILLDHFGWSWVTVAQPSGNPDLLQTALGVVLLGDLDFFRSNFVLATHVLEGV